MNVLVACEESQTVCKAFRERGHEAYSCDIQECSGGHPEWHILDSFLMVINGNCDLRLENGEVEHIDGRWDLIIGHPPCTYMSASSAVRMYHKDRDGNSVLVEERVKQMILSRDLFMHILNAECEKICIENPTPLKISCLPLPTQIIQPYMFGEPWSKRTLLWLKGLDRLKPTNIVEPSNGSWVSGNTKIYERARKGEAPQPVKFRDGKTRSKTFRGIANAMAEQWGVKDEYTYSV